MLGIIETLLRAKLAVESGNVPKVEISLDMNDPRAQRLAALARKLLLPTTNIHKSGLITKSGMVVPGRADEFIEALRREVGDDVMSDLESDLREQISVRTADRATSIQQALSADPATIAAVTEAFLGDETLRDAFTSDEKISFGNIADEIKSSGELPKERLQS